MFHLLQHVLIFEWNKQAYSQRSHLHLTPLIKHIKRQLNPTPFRQHFRSAHKSRDIEASEDRVTGGEMGHRLYIKIKKNKMMDVERSHLNPPLSCLCCGNAWRGSIILAILQIAFHSMKHTRVGPCFKNTPNVNGREITFLKIH